MMAGASLLVVQGSPKGVDMDPWGRNTPSCSIFECIFDGQGFFPSHYRELLPSNTVIG